jgi:hypothetical protein
MAQHKLMFQVRPCLDAYVFISIHMCWSGIELNFIPFHSTPTHVDWCGYTCIQTRPEAIELHTEMQAESSLCPRFLFVQLLFGTSSKSYSVHRASKNVSVFVPIYNGGRANCWEHWYFTTVKELLQNSDEVLKLIKLLLQIVNIWTAFY